MPWFECLIHGENFKFEIGDNRFSEGFYTTRFIEADDKAQAEQKQLAALKLDERLQDEASKANSPDAKVTFEEITELKAKPPKIGIWPFRRHVGGGFIFY